MKIFLYILAGFKWFVRFILLDVTSTLWRSLRHSLLSWTSMRTGKLTDANVSTLTKFSNNSSSTFNCFSPYSLEPCLEPFKWLLPMQPRTINSCTKPLHIVTFHAFQRFSHYTLFVLPFFVLLFLAKLKNNMTPDTWPSHSDVCRAADIWVERSGRV